MYKVLIVDDHEIVHVGIEMITINIGIDLKIYSAFTGNQALELLMHHHFDLMILDVNLPDTDGLELINVIFPRYPDIKILVYTSSTEELYSKHFYKKGVYGFVTKTSDKMILLDAIRTILKGSKHISETSKNILIRDYTIDQSRSILETLSEREVEVMKFLIKGYSNKEICKLLHLQPSTLSTYKYRIFDKTNVKNIIDLKLMADKNKIFE